MTARRILIITALFPLILGACSDNSVESDPSYSNKEREQLYKNGSLLSDEGGSNLLGGGSPINKNQDASGIGVNGFSVACCT